ncbi:failed axon connections [Schistocerca americana]|uniref:failed axon connections n=1 Tax=Schistocerca americana TaxID=7009 RepID=UPI001F4FFED4|nr:failed axon connections [Schistocerca americana]XP_047098869.1 failed axon connections [Schistocerca piceifrons]XP_049963638.1 failed axon connections [Schistocerca serialis cubense]
MASDENKAPADTTGEKEQQDKPEKQETGAADSNKQAEQQQESAGQQTAPAPAKPAPAVHKANFEKDVVYLYQFSRTPLIPSLSPYCLKVETWLRLAGIKYENVDHKMKFRSKKGQLPFVELNGEEIADSTIILKELGQRFGKDLDAGLTNDQKNVSHAMISMIENHLVWVVAWWRTKYPDNVIKGYKVNLQHALGSKIPNGILNFFFKFTFARKGAKKVKAQGIGVHKPEEIIEFGQNDLKVLSDMLADKPFFFGDEPTTLDVVAFSSLAQIYFIEKEVQYSLRDYMQENCANLVGHVNRMKERCFPDWEEICKTLDLNSHLPKPPPEEKESKGKEEEKKKEKDEKEGDKEGDKEIEKEIEKEKSEKEEKEVEKDVEENKQKEEKESK